MICIMMQDMTFDIPLTLSLHHKSSCVSGNASTALT